MSWFEFNLTIPMRENISAVEVQAGVEQTRPYLLASLEQYEKIHEDGVLHMIGNAHLPEDEIEELAEDLTVTARWLQYGPQPATLYTKYIGRDSRAEINQLRFIGRRDVVTAAICAEIEGQIEGLHKQLVTLLTPFNVYRFDEMVVSEAI